jgi:mannosyltransferase
VACAALLTLGAALVRWLARPGRPMWGDEAFTLALVRYPANEIREFLTHREINGGSYTLLLKGLLTLTDALGVEQLAAARGLSALLGVASVPAFYLLARRLAGERAALLAGLLLAVNLFHVGYSLEARAYTLAVLLVILSSSVLISLLDEPRWSLALLFGLLAGLATWAHLFAALVLAGQGLAALTHPRLGSSRAAPLGGLAFGGALSLAVMARGAWGDGGQVVWVGALGWDQLTLLLWRLGGGVRLLLAPVAMGLGAALLAMRRGGRERFLSALTVALLLVPLLITVLVSTVKPMLVPRYLLVSLPGFLLLAALGVTALRRPALVIGVGVLLAGLGLREVRLDRFGDPLWQPIDTVAARVVALAEPGDVLVVSHPAMALSLDRELSRLGQGPGPERVSPVADDLLDLYGDRRPPLAERVRGHAGVLFLLFAEQPQSAQLREALAAVSEVTNDESYGGVRLLRLERR